MRIFLSYRRDDSSAYAGRLYDALAREFGRHSVFQDVVTVRAGENFAQAMTRALENCDVALVVIGPGWHAPDTDGTSRLFHPDDYVRIEIAQALASNLRIVPVLVDGAHMPAPADLPEELGELAVRQAASLRNEAWQRDVHELIHELRGGAPPQRDRRRWWAAAGVGVLVVVAVVGLAWWNGGAERNGTTLAPWPSCQTPAPPEWIRAYDPDTEAVVVGSEEGRLQFTVTDASYLPLPDSDAWEFVVATVVRNLGPEPASLGEWLYRDVEISTFPFEDKTCFSSPRDVLDVGQSARITVGFEVGEEPTGKVDLRTEYEGEVGAVSVKSG